MLPTVESPRQIFRLEMLHLEIAHLQSVAARPNQPAYRAARRN
ncbi:MAG TPA: hypothetical protein VND20_06670 [Candidatus Binataceae bacterium]|nr:hypothetical protein [Candidatus Binataceae bacterium]HVC44485.1 hypothetical protein [Candidatus Binataceae bacterium]